MQETESNPSVLIYSLHFDTIDILLIMISQEPFYSWKVQSSENLRAVNTLYYHFVMRQKVSFIGAIYFTKASVYLACTWPPSKTATNWEITKYHITWILLFISNLCLLIPLLFSLSKYHTNSLLLTQAAGFLGATSNLAIKMIIYRIHYERTQTLIHEMEDFLRNAKPNVLIICRRYVNRCSTFHFLITMLNYLTTAMVICTPLVFDDQILPTNAVYPFSVEARILIILAYIHQSVAGFQCSSGVTVDCQAALLLWYAGARLEMLVDEFKKVSDIEELKIFVHKHRKLLAYAIDVSNTMAYIALASMTACGVAAIMSGVQLFSNQPLSVKIQFAPVALIASMNLFICAWPADNLINVCNKLENAVYNTSWIDMSLKMMKNILMVLQRCQRPVIVSFGGFLPCLSLASYASFLSVLFSYFTTLRLVLSTQEEKIDH